MWCNLNLAHCWGNYSNMNVKMLHWLHAVKFNVLIMNKNANLRSAFTSAFTLTVGVWRLKVMHSEWLNIHIFDWCQWISEDYLCFLWSQSSSRLQIHPHRTGASKKCPEFEIRTTAWLNWWPRVYQEYGFRWGRYVPSVNLPTKWDSSEDECCCRGVRDASEQLVEVEVISTLSHHDAVNLPQYWSTY